VLLISRLLRNEAFSVRTHKCIMHLPEKEEWKDAREDGIGERFKLVDEATKRRSWATIAVDLHLPSAEAL
jgi:hypothetical protein